MNKINIFSLLLLILLTGCSIKSNKVMDLVNNNYDEIVEFASCDSGDLCYNLTKYDFSSSIIDFGSMYDSDMNLKSKYFNTKIENYYEEGFVYVFENDFIIPLQWCNVDLNEASKSGNAYIIKFNEYDVHVIPIKDNIYYFSFTWHEKRPEISL